MWAGSQFRAELQLLLIPLRPQPLNTCLPSWDSLSPTRPVKLADSHIQRVLRNGQGCPHGVFVLFCFLTELPPNSVFHYKIQNSGPILTTYFEGHKSTSPLFFQENHNFRACFQASKFQFLFQFGLYI